RLLPNFHRGLGADRHTRRLGRRAIELITVLQHVSLPERFSFLQDGPGQRPGLDSVSHHPAGDSVCFPHLRLGLLPERGLRKRSPTASSRLDAREDAGCERVFSSFSEKEKYFNGCFL